MGQLDPKNRKNPVFEVKMTLFWVIFGVIFGPIFGPVLDRFLTDRFTSLGRYTAIF